MVIAIIALLIGLLIPGLAKARQSARTIVCLNNLRQLQVAHVLYSDTYKGAFVDAGLSHGGPPNLASVRASWINALRPFYGGTVNVRSPVDRSPFWPVSQGGTHNGMTLEEFELALASGRSVPLTRLARWTSYGLNDWLTTSFRPNIDPREPFNVMSKIDSPESTIQFLQMTQGIGDNSPYARSDHVHPSEWDNGPPGSAPSIAARQMDVSAHGGPAKSADGLANYGFVDGHAATRRFREVFTSYEKNLFFPPVARQ